MVPQITHRGYAGGVAGRIRRTHICRKETKNITESHFKLNHLATADGLGQGGEIGMRPGVRGNLVTVGVHLLDHVRPCGGSVDCTLSIVDTGNVECSLCIVGVQKIDHGICVHTWAIIKSQRDIARLNAVVEIPIWHIPQMGPCNLFCCSTAWQGTKVNPLAPTKHCPMARI